MLWRRYCWCRRSQPQQPLRSEPTKASLEPRHTGSRAAKSQLHPGVRLACRTTAQANAMSLCGSMVAAARSHDTGMRSDVQSSDTHDIRERENMHQHHIQPGNAKTLLRLLIGIRMARLSLFSAVALAFRFCFP